jgi:hypothetical protein
MKRFSLILIVFNWLVAVWCHADGGAVIARHTVNDLHVTVLASPVPLRAGPVDVSVLVQSGERTVFDATVEVAWRSFSASPPDWLPPCCTMDSVTEGFPAVRAHSNNKFLYSAIVPVKWAGPSEFIVKVSRGGLEASVRCPIEVRQALPPALAFWPWLLFPPVAIAGFALHQSLLRSRQPGDKAARLGKDK